MKAKFAARLLGAQALLLGVALTLQPGIAIGQAQGAQERTAARPLNFWAQQEKVNAWTVGLAAGLIEGAPLRLVSEMATVVDDGATHHVLPIVTRGATENLSSLPYLRGIDLAIINSRTKSQFGAPYGRAKR
jgi:hypothetical protein